MDSRMKYCYKQSLHLLTVINQPRMQLFTIIAIDDVVTIEKLVFLEKRLSGL